MLGCSMQPQQLQLQLCLHIKHVAQGCCALQHQQMHSMSVLAMRPHCAQSACAQLQQFQQLPAMHAADTNRQSLRSESTGRAQHSTQHLLQDRYWGVLSSSWNRGHEHSSRAGLIRQAGSKLHAAWGSSCGGSLSSSWSDCSGSSRCLSTRRAAAASTASQILDELSKLREGQDAQVI